MATEKWSVRLATQEEAYSYFNTNAATIYLQGINTAEALDADKNKFLRFDNLLSGLGVSGFTQGSVLFAGASGGITQDNTNFYFDDTLNRLGIESGTSPTAKIEINSSSDDFLSFVNTTERLNVNNLGYLHVAAQNTSTTPECLTIGSTGGTGIGTLSFAGRSGMFNADASFVFYDEDDYFEFRNIRGGSSTTTTRKNAKFSIDTSGTFNTTFWLAQNVTAPYLDIKSRDTGGVRIYNNTSGATLRHTFNDNYTCETGTIRATTGYIRADSSYIRAATNVYAEGGGVFIGNSSVDAGFTYSNVLTFNNGSCTVVPSNSLAVFCQDLSAGNTMLSWRGEGTSIGGGTPTQDTTIAVNVNGTTYYLLASTSAT